MFVLYGSGFIAQFLNNYDQWKALDEIINTTISPKLPDVGFLKCLTSVFIFPYGLYGLGISLGIIFVFVVFVLRVNFGNNSALDKERNLTYSDEGAYGTSGYMTDREIKSILELTSDLKHCKGNILGKLNGKAVCIPENTRMNKNIAVYGASGSMKSRAFARNMIFQCVRRGESLIITDPKSELFEDSSQYLRNNDYIVKAFNLVNPENSDSWNCLKEIGGQELMAQLFCDVIIKNTGSVKGDHFWDNSELNLLKALVLYVDQGYPEEMKNIGEVYKLLTLSSEQELTAMFSTLPVSHPAKAPYSIFRQAADSVRGGVVIGLGSRIQVFQNQLIKDITAHDEIDLTLPGKQKCAYYCITSDQDSTFDFLSSLFLSFIFIKLVRFADKDGIDGRLPVPVHILADELANIGVIPDLTKKISTIRSRGMSLSVIFQNLAQMRNRYPQDQWQEIIGNCDTQLFLGCTDEITAKYISDRTGEITIGITSQSRQLFSMRVTNWTPEFKETSSIGRRKLLTQDEVLRLPLDKALIILRGQKVLKVDKFDYMLHPESKKLIKSKVRDYVPNWRKSFKEQEKSEVILEKTVLEEKSEIKKVTQLPKVKIKAEVITEAKPRLREPKTLIPDQLREQKKLVPELVEVIEEEKETNVEAKIETPNQHHQTKKSPKIETQLTQPEIVEIWEHDLMEIDKDSFMS